MSPISQPNPAEAPAGKAAVETATESPTAESAASEGTAAKCGAATKAAAAKTTAPKCSAATEAAPTTTSSAATTATAGQGHAASHFTEYETAGGEKGRQPEQKSAFSEIHNSAPS